MIVVAPSHIGNELNIAEINNCYKFYCRSLNFDRYIVLNNSLYDVPIKLFDPGIEYIHLDGCFSSDPAIGECTMLHEYIKNLEPNDLILKIHARCPVLNIDEFIWRLGADRKGFTLRKGIFSDLIIRPSVERPYVDTRIFAMEGRDSFLLKRSCEILNEMRSLKFEHALYISLFLNSGAARMPSLRFIPRMSGRSGHGNNYSSFRSQIKSRILRAFASLGLS